MLRTFAVGKARITLSTKDYLLRIDPVKFLRKLKKGRLDPRLAYVIAVEHPQLLDANLGVCPACGRKFKNARGVRKHLRAGGICYTAVVKAIEDSVLKYRVSTQFIEFKRGRYYTVRCFSKHETWFSAYEHLRKCLGW